MHIDMHTHLPCNAVTSRDGETTQPQASEAIRKGPWSMEEDLILINYIANHGEGVWNNLARSAGLMRTGKSCRLRWLNYLKPDVRRGNITPEEEHLIVELQSRWGNRWSKIAKQLPGRTDNEIKNFWRTKIHKKDRLVRNPNHRSQLPKLDFQNQTLPIVYNATTSSNNAPPTPPAYGVAQFDDFFATMDPPMTTSSFLEPMGGLWSYDDLESMLFGGID